MLNDSILDGIFDMHARNVFLPEYVFSDELILYIVRGTQSTLAQ